MCPWEHHPINFLASQRRVLGYRQKRTKFCGNRYNGLPTFLKPPRFSSVLVNRTCRYCKCYQLIFLANRSPTFSTGSTAELVTPHFDGNQFFPKTSFDRTHLFFKGYAHQNLFYYFFFLFVSSDDYHISLPREKKRETLCNKDLI